MQARLDTQGALAPWSRSRKAGVSQGVIRADSGPARGDPGKWRLGEARLTFTEEARNLNFCMKSQHLKIWLSQLIFVLVFVRFLPPRIG